VLNSKHRDLSEQKGKKKKKNFRVISTAGLGHLIFIKSQFSKTSMKESKTKLSIQLNDI